MKTPIVSSEWLNKHIDDENIIVIDASQKIEADNISIRGARYFDIKNDFSSTSKFPNTFPTAGQFESECQKLGINKGSKLVIYDNKGVYSSPRVWWMFKTMGHQNVVVLDGGLQDWLNNGYSTQIGFDTGFGRGNFIADLAGNNVKDHAFVCANIISEDALLIDARSSGRFNGKAPEPRQGLKSGHIPNSINLPFTEVLKDGKLKPLIELEEVFADLNKEDRPFVFTCGSGITACIILLACELVRNHSLSVYDGSWTEFALLDKA